MIHRNYQPIETNSEVFGRYKKERDELAKHYKGRFPVAIGVKYKFAMTKDGIQKPGKNIYLKYSTLVEGENGSDTITYCPVAPVKDKNGEYEYRENGQWIKHHQLIVYENNIDLLWYVTKTSLYKNGRLYIIDEVKDADEFVNEKASKAKAEYYLYGNDDVTVRNKLILVAQAYGIPGVSTLTDSQVKKRLAETLEAKYSTDKFIYKKFLDDLEVDRATKIKSNLQRALDKNIVFWNMKENTLEKASVDPDQTSIVYRLKADELGNKEDAAANFFMNIGQDQYTWLRESLGDESPIDFDNNEEVRKWAKKLNIPVGARKLDDVKAEIREQMKIA